MSQSPAFIEHFECYGDEELPQKRTAHIGIGGSGLGPKLLSHYLNVTDRYRVFDHLNFEQLEQFKPEQLVVVSKSGSTLETLFLMRQALEKLPQLKENLILISDGTKGDLIQLSETLGARHLSMPESLGGRYCIFSAVGGVLLNIVGKSIKDFRNFDRREAEDLGKSIATFALQSDRKNICFWSYNERISLLSDWFSQLWAESLGKNKKGIFSISCNGPRDQHSLLQYFADGDTSNCHLFVSQALVENQDPCKDPLWQKLPTLKNYQERSLNDLLLALAYGTKSSLEEKGEPVFHLELGQGLSELGKICYALMVATVQMAENWGINPFDQPGVERSKELARSQLKDQ